MARYDAFRAFLDSPASMEWAMSAYEQSLVDGETFWVQGHCEVCDRPAGFLADYRHCWTASDGKRYPNWRERLDCPHCSLNNRMRAALAFVLSSSKPGDAIYLTEAVTDLARIVTERRGPVTTSEYLSDGTASGATNAAGIRHEDVTRLTFADDSFDLIGTFDVLEHVPDYRRAFSEFVRVLRPGGMLVVTVPLSIRLEHSVTRASVAADGSITHHLPPDIHGNPLSAEGSLSFYDYGWDFVQHLTEAGFEDAGLSLFWDPAHGYLGGYQFRITAHKPRRTTMAGALRRLLRRG